ncbi:MAG: DegT/DnrJ/EryC1/StrS family aminotransferase [Cyanobacteriota bacterium]
MPPDPSPEQPIYVTRPHLPPLAEVTRLLEGVWERRVLTNGGPLHQQLEQELAAYLGVEHISLFANGTLALLVALKALRLQGEVITTPFSFVATSEALSWNGLEPVFADIQAGSYGLDPASIEASITPRTTAILPVHCYGFPCDVEAIQRIADDYNLKVIYDAAHAFGVECHCGSLLQHGDLAVLSFHATKVFNNFEGGAIICPDAKTKKRIDRLMNFGFVDEVSVAANGINAKMSELHAAVGLAQLPGIDDAIAERKRVAELFKEQLAGVAGLELPDFHQALRSNYAYMPVRVTAQAAVNRETLVENLRAQGIVPRRYFHPLIPEFQYYRSNASADPERYPVAVQCGREVLCLPIYPELGDGEVLRICSAIRLDLAA